MKMTEADKLGLTSFLSGSGHSTRLTRTSMMVARAMMKKTMTMMMKRKIHSRRLLLSTHEWSSNDGDYEHYAGPGAMITMMMVKQNNFQSKHWLRHHPFDGFLQFDGFSVNNLLMIIIFMPSGPEWQRTILYCGFWFNSEYCTIFHFPPSVRPPPSQVWHINFFDILTVYTMKTIYFLNAYHLGR